MSDPLDERGRGSRKRHGMAEIEEVWKRLWVWTIGRYGLTITCIDIMIGSTVYHQPSCFIKPSLLRLGFVHVSLRFCQAYSDVVVSELLSLPDEDPIFIRCKSCFSREEEE